MREMSDDQWTTFIDGSAALQYLVIEPEWHEAVLTNLKVIAQAAQLVSAHDMGDEDEAAPVFAA